MSDYPPVTIPGTEVRTLRSAFVNQEYLISVALPFHYEEHPDRRYPVIYYEGFKFTYEIIPTCTHGGAMPGGYSAGLYTVLA